MEVCVCVNIWEPEQCCGGLQGGDPGLKRPCLCRLAQSLCVWRKGEGADVAPACIPDVCLFRPVPFVDY